MKTQTEPMKTQIFDNKYFGAFVKKTEKPIKATEMLKHFFLFLVMFSCITGSATIYYVSSSGGNDSNSGLSPTSPWKTLGKVNTFRAFLPGDNILLKAGDSFEGPLKISASGIILNPIKIGRYGSGTNPIIYGDHPSVKWSAVAGQPRVFVANVQGGSVKDVYGSDGSCYKLSNRGTLSLGKWLDTMSVNNWGYDIALKTTYIKTAGGPLPPVIHLFEFAVVACSASYVVLENLDVRNGFIGFSASGTGVVIRNNSVSDMTQNGIYLARAIKNETSNNKITRTAETSIYLMKCQNSWIHHNTITNTVGTILGKPLCLRRNPERAGIGLQMGKNNLVEQNSLSNIYSSFFDYWYESGTVTRFNYGYRAGGATAQGGTKLQLYGNIFNLDGGNKGIMSGYEYDLSKNPLSEEGPNVIFNNVVYNFDNYGLYSGSDKVIFRNNILKTNSDNAVFVNLCQGTSCDYNSYYRNSRAAKNGWNFGGDSRIGYKTIESFRSATGQDIHSFLADPKFVSSTPLFAKDFQLSASSPCINKGQNLKSAGLVLQGYTDYLGLSIPQSSTPDIGAFEYSITNTDLNSIVGIFPFLEKNSYQGQKHLQKNEPVTVWGR